MVKPVVAASVGRISFGMVPLALVLVIAHELDSYAVAGSASGVFAVAAGLLAPARGRIIDRRGAAAPLMLMATVHAAGLIGLALAATDGSAALVLVAAGAAGATVPPLGAAMRSLWTRTLQAPRLRTAYAFEAVVQETAFILGPLLVGLLSVTVGAPASLMVAAGVALIGTAAFAATRPVRDWSVIHPPAGERALIRRPALVVLLVSVVVGNAAFGVLEVALPAAGTSLGSAARAGLLLALLSVGSIVGGLVYGAMPQSTSAFMRYAIASMVFALGLVPLVVASAFWQFAVACVIAGLVIAPALVVVYELLDELTPPHAATEATTWLTTANLVGVAAGAFAGGQLVESASLRSAFVFAVAVASLASLVALGLALARRRPRHRGAHGGQVTP